MVLMEGSEKGLDLGSRSIIDDLDLIGIWDLDPFLRGGFDRDLDQFKKDFPKHC